MAKVRFKKPKPIKKITARQGNLTSYALQRPKRADQWFPGYKAALKRRIDEYVRDVARAAGQGMPYPESAHLKFARTYTATKARWIPQMVQDGWEYAGNEVTMATAAVEDSKTGTGWAGKQTPRGRVVIGGSDKDTSRSRDDKAARMNDFLLRGNFSNIDKFVATTSVSEVKTQRDELERVWRDAELSRDPKTGMAWTNREISKAIRERGLANSEWRSDMLARTGTSWSMDEGAKQRYRASGVTVVEWIASIDDVTCPFCATMHNVAVRIEDPFWAGTDSMQVEKPDGSGYRTLNFVGDVEHPPLHPNCRCTLIPVVRQRNVQVGSVIKKATGQRPAPKPKAAAPTKQPVARKDITEMTEAEFMAYEKQTVSRIESLTNRTKNRLTKALNDRKAAMQRSRELWNEYFRRKRTPSPLSAEKIALRNKMDKLAAKHRDRADVLRKRLDNIVTRVLRQKENATITIKSRIRGRGLLKADAKAAADEISKVLSKRHTPRDMNVSLRLTPRYRAHHEPRAIVMQANAQRQNFLHELGHEIENQTKDIGQAAARWRNARTSGAPLRKVRDMARERNLPYKHFDSWEVARDGGFVHPYVGKEYSGNYQDMGYRSNPTEVTSVGLPRMMMDPVQFYHDDPGHFDFIFRLLTGRQFL